MINNRLKEWKSSDIWKKTLRIACAEKNKSSLNYIFLIIVLHGYEIRPFHTQGRAKAEVLESRLLRHLSLRRVK